MTSFRFAAARFELRSFCNILGYKDRSIAEAPNFMKQIESDGPVFPVSSSVTSEETDASSACISATNSAAFFQG